MIICILMFSAQLWYIATTTCSSEYCVPFDDPEDAFARTWDITDSWRVESRKAVILISTPITFLLCIILLLLTRRTTVLKLVLASILSFVLGMFFLVFSFYSMQFIILMGTKLSILSQELNIIFLLPVTLLAPLFMALAYSSIIQLREEKESQHSNKWRNCCFIFAILLSISFLFLSLTTITTTTLVITSTMQDHWNTTRDHSYDKECRDETEYDDNYNYRYHYRETTTTTTTVAPKEKPDKCFGKRLDNK